MVQDSKHKFIGVTWFTGRETTGVVLVEDIVTGVLKAWIEPIDRVDETVNIEHIIAWGAKFPVHEAIILISRREGAWSSFYQEELLLKPKAW